MEIRGIRDGSRRDDVGRVIGAVHILLISGDENWDAREYDGSRLDENIGCVPRLEGAKGRKGWYM